MNNELSEYYVTKEGKISYALTVREEEQPTIFVAIGACYSEVRKKSLFMLDEEK